MLNSDFNQGSFPYKWNSNPAVHQNHQAALKIRFLGPTPKRSWFCRGFRACDLGKPVIFFFRFTTWFWHSQISNHLLIRPFTVVLRSPLETSSLNKTTTTTKLLTFSCYPGYNLCLHLNSGKPWEKFSKMARRQAIKLQLQMEKRHYSNSLISYANEN